MKKVIIIIIALIALTGYFANAQHINNLSLYSLNRYSVNPAAAGTKAYTYVSTSYNKYWSGVNGAPELQSLSAHSLLSQKTAVGLNIFSENTGLSGKMGFEATFAYHMPISEGGTKVSFGLSGIVTQHKLFKENFIVDNPDDDVIANAENSVILPDANFGVSLYKENQFFVDFSIRQLLARQVNYLNSENLENIQIRHYSLGAGYLLKMNDNVQMEPSILITATENTDIQLRAGVIAILKKTISVGCYYRTNDALLPFIGFDTKNVMFAYSYGILMGELADYSTGSHEIMLILKLNNAKSNLE